MSGPQKGLTSNIEEIINQTSDINVFVERMRRANRRLTGSTGEQPTKLAAINQGGSGSTSRDVSEEPPLKVRLTLAVELLNQARAELNDEITYFESLSETGQKDMPEHAAPSYSGR